MSDIHDKATLIINRQLTKLDNTPPSESSLSNWQTRTVGLLAGLVIDSELAAFQEINETSFLDDKKAFKRFLLELKDDIEAMPDIYLLDEPHSIEIKPLGDPSADKRSIHGSRVFVVHGHDTLSKLDVSRTLEKLGLEVTILHEQPNVGATVMEKFEEHAAEVGFAVVLLTPDDEGYPRNKSDEIKPRARQNVILELGYFVGLLGRNRVCVLHKGDVEIPSDYVGVVYIPLDEAGAWRFTLAKELKASGLDIDLNILV